MSELKHYGILGQKWGQRNGPPYPLKGGAHSNLEKRLNPGIGISDRYKRHGQLTIGKGRTISTLSYDPDRISKGNMFYAAYTRHDKDLYMRLFNKKLQTINGSVRKYKIDAKASNKLKIANEEQGASAFKKLYSNNRDFYNYVTDPQRMQDRFVDSKYIYKGYRQSRDVLDRIRKGETPDGKDLQILYRMFNYVIPNEDKDTVNQTKKFFKELKEDGYSGLLDTNDALYGSFKGDMPVIIFDVNAFVPVETRMTTTADVALAMVHQPSGALRSLKNSLKNSLKSKTG